MLLELHVGFNELGVFRDDVGVFDPHIHEVLFQFQCLHVLGSKLVLQCLYLHLKPIDIVDQALFLAFLLFFLGLIFSCSAIQGKISRRVRRREYGSTAGDRVIKVSVGSLGNFELCLKRLQLVQSLEVLILKVPDFPVASLSRLIVLS